ncbi:PIN domain-containing protein [Paraburkholderia sp.]|uniref:PIN domain-containing protein n=1 Tax=Paraburkholderia sp. TaxID=1926495 RepID=UPI0025F274F4|nr:PIN domain-containing protein [Paraburkholderia sp.]
MAARGRPRRRRVLSVVFDTNAIFNKEFDALVSQATRDVIAQHSNHGDLGVRWVIPEIVRGEREYQMRNEYRGISSHVTRAESLFGQEWGITQEAVEQRIAARITEELTAQRIEVVPCDTGRVDWADVMRRACFREPPFERGQTEKGFRDAVVCETFVQLATDLVGGDTAVLVSNDRLIKQYIESRGVQGNRARVVDDLKALDDEIQLRVANVDENTQALIEQSAQRLFYPGGNPVDPRCLWKREELYEKIMVQFGERLKQVPMGFEYVFIGHEIWNPRLASKNGGRVHFESVYAVESGFRYWVPAANVSQDTPVNQLASLANLSPDGQPVANQQVSTLGLLGWLQTPAAGEWKQYPKGEKDKISIRWSATFSRHRTLTHATIDAIDFVTAAASNAAQ